MSDKKRTALDWDDLRYFLAVVRHGNLSAAARQLRVNHATVSRRIAGLEATLARTLFDRRSEGYALSSDGEAVLADAEAMEQAALALGDRLEKSDGPAGVVRISTIRSLADLILAEALGRLRQFAPRLTIELLTDMRVVSLAQREADIALRLGQPKDSKLVGRKVAEIGYGFYASPERAAEWTAGRTIPLIGYDEGSDYTAEYAWFEQNFARRPMAFRSNSNLSQAAAARGGFGIAMLPRYLGGGDAGLRRVDFGPIMPNRELWMLSRSELAGTTRVRVVLDALAAILAGKRDVLAGSDGDADRQLTNTPQ